MSSESCVDCNRDVTNSASLDICPTCYARLADAEDAAVSLSVENARLRNALALAVRWMGDPSDPLGTFEDIGDWFYRDTGLLRPGKSEPLECGDRSEERAAAWKEWTTKKRDHVRATCLSALGETPETWRRNEGWNVKHKLLRAGDLVEDYAKQTAHKALVNETDEDPAVQLYVTTLKALASKAQVYAAQYRSSYHLGLATGTLQETGDGSPKGDP